MFSNTHTGPVIVTDEKIGQSPKQDKYPGLLPSCPVFILHTHTHKIRTKVYQWVDSLKKHSHPPPPFQNRTKGPGFRRLGKERTPPPKSVCWRAGKGRGRSRFVSEQQPGSRTLPLRAILCLAYFYLIEIGSKRAQGWMGMEDIIAFNYFSRTKMDSSSSLEVRQQQSN